MTRIDQEQRTKPLKPLPKPFIQPVAQKRRNIIFLSMIQDFESYYSNAMDALIGFEHVYPYRPSDLATLGRAITFNRLFLADQHPGLLSSG